MILVHCTQRLLLLLILMVSSLITSYTRSDGGASSAFFAAVTSKLVSTMTAFCQSIYTARFQCSDTDHDRHLTTTQRTDTHMSCSSGSHTRGDRRKSFPIFTVHDPLIKITHVKCSLFSSTTVMGT